MCSDIIKLLNNYFNRSFYIIKICYKDSVTNIRQIYNNYNESFILRYFFENNTIINLTDLKSGTGSIIKIDANLLNQIDRYLDMKQLEIYLDKVFEPIIRGKSYKAFCDNMYILCTHIAQHTEGLMNFNFLNEDNIMSITSVKSALEYIREKYTYYYLLLKQSKNYSNYVEKAVKFIYQNYKNNLLSIQEIASNIALSSTRLRTIFKQETGKTIYQFITDIRLNKAKQLLLDSKRKKLDQIAKEVGYLNGKYFSRAFKREIGISPEDFRKGRNV